MPKLSIIIPVYETPVGLFDACLKSVAEQDTNYKCEIIVVDDGSKDGKIYKDLCEKYGADYHRKKNGGVSSSRNAGIKHAKGDYVLFVDSDDYLEPDYITKCIKILIDRKVDVLICGHTVVEGDRKTPWNPPVLPRGTRENIIVDLILKNHYYTCAGSFFRRSIANKHEFHKDIAMGEDTLFVFECCEGAHISVETPAVYYYVKNSHSATKANAATKTATLELAKKQFADNTALYDYIAKAYPEFRSAVDTALTSKAYDALSLYADNPSVTKDDYIDLCRFFASQVHFESEYISQTEYSSSKKKGMKLLARRNYAASFRLNRIKNLVKNLRSRI